MLYLLLSLMFQVQQYSKVPTAPHFYPISLENYAVPVTDTGRIFMDSLILDQADGSSFRFAEVEGKVLLLDFWATWCKPCREQHPLVEQLRSQMDTSQFEVITISIDRDQKQWAQFFSKHDWSGIHVHIGWKEAHPLFRMIRNEMVLANGKKISSASVPQYYLVDRDLQMTKIADISEPAVLAKIKDMLLMQVLDSKGDG